MLPIIGDLITAGLKIIDKVIPDPAAKAEAQYRLLQLQQTGELAQINAELAVATAQADINKVEAGNANLFVSGWRPAVGWICVAALFANYLGAPLLNWLSAMQGWPLPPKLDLSDLLTLLAGMLGLGTLRTVEKLKGAA